MKINEQIKKDAKEIIKYDSAAFLLFPLLIQKIARAHIEINGFYAFTFGGKKTLIIK